MTTHTVPCSELAMHMRIADKVILNYEIHGNQCYVWVDLDEQPYQGPIAELLPHELRPTEKAKGVK